MLKRIESYNFKCFKNKTVFDFTKTNYKLLEQNTVGKVLKGVLFVGDNASGKTTSVQPIKILLDLLFKESEVKLFFYQCLFSKEKNTTLKYEFDIEGHDIVYTFSFDNNSITEEKLFVDKIVFIERIGENAKLDLGNGEAFHEVDKSLLFLRKVYFNTKFTENETLMKWFEFLKKSIYINAYSRTVCTYNGENLTLKKYMENYGVDKLNGFLESNNFKYSIQYEQFIENKGIRYEMAEDEGKMVFFLRNEIAIPIPIFMESTGNQTLVNIMPAILCAVERGGLLIIDEFSSGFHNKLEELIVKYIMNNSKNTQLFFVTHSTNLLSNSLLRPDQIYAVEMEKDEGSKLYRFSDEQPRVAQNLEKMYLSGVFGGVPEYGINKG